MYARWELVQVTQIFVVCVTYFERWLTLLCVVLACCQVAFGSRWSVEVWGYFTSLNAIVFLSCDILKPFFNIFFIWNMQGFFKLSAVITIAQVSPFFPSYSVPKNTSSKCILLTFYCCFKLLPLVMPWTSATECWMTVKHGGNLIADRIWKVRGHLYLSLVIRISESKPTKEQRYLNILKKNLAPMCWTKRCSMYLAVCGLPLLLLLWLIAFI